MDSYSESISSNEESSDDRTDSKGIDSTLHQIALGLQSAAEGYLTLASHISKVAPYELPQVIAQIPPLLWMLLCL